MPGLADFQGYSPHDRFGWSMRSRDSLVLSLEEYKVFRQYCSATSLPDNVLVYLQRVQDSPNAKSRIWWEAIADWIRGDPILTGVSLIPLSKSIEDLLASLEETWKE